MGQAYDDSRYDVCKILTFPGEEKSFLRAPGNVSHVVFDEDIILTEFGVVITQVYTAGGALAQVQLREGSTVLGSITIASASAVGAVLSTTTLTTTAIDKGNTLIFYHSVSNTTTGKCDGYIKYRERFKSG